MYASMHFTGPTVKLLVERLQQTYAKTDLHLVRRISALLDVATGERVAQVAEKYAVTRQTIYDWLVAFLVHGLDSLVYRRSPGRKPRLTPEQRKRLVELIEAGPEAAGFDTACWTSLLVQQWIHREFDVLYNRHYICTLLHSLNFSFQKARFESDHLNEAARKEWWATTLAQVLKETSQHIIVIQDGARYHTAKATRAWFEAHCDRLTVFQLPSYSPDYNPIEFLWKKMKHRATHNKYFAEFANLVKSVNEGLAYFAEQAREIQALIGLYVETLKPTMLATA
jgi:transposase